MVEPAVAEPAPTLDTLVSVKSALAKTLRTAVAVLVLVPTEVVSEPEAIVLVIGPATELVTTAVTVQLEAGGIRVPNDRVKVPAPVAAAAVPPLQLVAAAGVEAFTRPEGYTSVNKADSVADASACVLVIVMVSKAVPPALMELTEKVFEIVGLESDTESKSAAEHTPPTQDPETLVFVTLAGGVIDATLLT